MISTNYFTQFYTQPKIQLTMTQWNGKPAQIQRKKTIGMDKDFVPVNKYRSTYTQFVEIRVY